VRELTALGIQPDVLVCRCEKPLPDGERAKIALFCNVRKEAVVPALDAKSIYGVPLQYHAEGLDREVLRAFGIETPPASPNLSRWTEIMDRLENPEGEVTIGVVGKYVGLPDAYKSLHEALIHGGIANRVKVNIQWLDAELFEHEEDVAAKLEPLHGILVPGGFGERGSDGKIASVRFARERNVPFFGICLGMQMACIEGARNLAGIAEASTTEFGATDEPVVGLITEWMSKEGLQQRAADGDLGGTMRLGAYPAALTGNSVVESIYGTREISERHRHRYEVNVHYRDALEKGGLLFTGMSPDGELPEIVERPDHPWFVGVQFHPELKSKPFDPHPLFASFVEAAV
jgi:CTP synthase